MQLPVLSVRDMHGSDLCQADAFLGVSKPQVFHFFFKAALCCDRKLRN
jgi:hypothetical protein